MSKILLAWTRLFEFAVIVGGLSAAFVVGVGVDWVSHVGEPVFVQNPDRTKSFVEGADAVKAGAWIKIHRSVQRVDNCSISAGTWIVQDGNVLFHIDDYTSFAKASTDFYDQKNAFYLHPGIPPGRYSFRTLLVCDRNPLVTATQQLWDLPFEVVEP